MSLCGCTPTFCGPASLGCFGSCDKVYTGLIADKTGMYRVVYTLNKTQVVWQFPAVKGQEICFKHQFREYGVACFKIVTPDLCYLADETGNCNFTAEIYPSFEPTEVPDTIPFEEKEIPAISCPFPEVPVWMLEKKVEVIPVKPKEEKLVLETKKTSKKERLPFERKQITAPVKERLVLERKNTAKKDKKIRLERKSSNKIDKKLPLEK